MNGSLYLQVEHDRCLGCNECAIAVACPTQAFHRIPAAQAEILKRRAEAVLGARGRRLMREAGDDAQQYREGAELLARALRQRQWRQQHQGQTPANSTSEGTGHDA
jgi:Fe-S-cluster-containing hydrogenase component 2